MKTSQTPQGSANCSSTIIRKNRSFPSQPKIYVLCENIVSVDTVRVLDLTGDWSLDDGLGDGGHGVPLLEALTYTRCGELHQLGCE